MLVRQIKGTLRSPTQGILMRAAEGFLGSPWKGSRVLLLSLISCIASGLESINPVVTATANWGRKGRVPQPQQGI